jgi:cell division protein FtsL
MLNRPINIIKINIVLSLVVVVLSFYTIIWHHQNYLLYLKSNEVRNQNQKIVALKKQILIEYSEKISGAEIKGRAVNILQMKPFNPDKVPTILL